MWFNTSGGWWGGGGLSPQQLFLGVVGRVAHL